MERREKPKSREERLVNALVDEAEGLRSTYEGDHHIYQALTNKGIREQSERMKYFRIIKKELARRTKIKEEKRAAETQKKAREAEDLKEFRQKEMLEQAAEAEKLHPKDAYSVEDDE